MKKLNLRILSAILIAAILLATLPVTAFAAGESDVVVGNNYTLSSGQTLSSTLFLVGGTVNLENGSTVNADVILIGSSGQAAGTITGNLVVLGGSLDLASTFILNGDLSTAGANINRAAGAQINGQINNGATAPIFVFPSGVRVPFSNPFQTPVLRGAGYLLGIILWALVAMLVAMFLHVPLARTSQTGLAQPLLSGALGLLTIILVPIILVLLAITICLIPVSILGAFALAIAWAYGLIAFGLEVGKRISAAFKREWHPALAAGLGTLLLMAILNGLQTIVPCIGWIPEFLVGLVGLGAVILTQFGRQPYPQAPTLLPPSSSAIVPPAGGSEITPP